MSTFNFQAQFSELQQPLFAFALRLTKNYNDAQDLLQETGLRAFHYRERFTVGSNFRAWIITIMRNTFINNYRRSKTKIKVAGPVDDLLTVTANPSVSNSGSDNLHLQELQELIAEIGDNFSRPFLMFYDGYQYEEIAQDMEIPIGTVKSRIFFARKKIKELMAVRYN